MLARLPETCKWGSEVERRDPTQEALRCSEVGSECAVQPGSMVGQRVCDKAWLRPRAAHCCPLAIGEGDGSSKAYCHTLPSTPSRDPETEEAALLLRNWVPLAVTPVAKQKFDLKDSPPGSPPGEEQFCPSLGRPFQG